MKHANGETFTCVTFHKTVQAYIDDELPELIAIDLLNHCVFCKDCHTLLNDMIHLKRRLSDLSPIVVSPAFDTRLKEQIFHEEIHLKSPWYRYTLFLQNNAKPVFALASVILFITAMALWGSYRIKSGNIPSAIVEIQNKLMPDLRENIGGESIYYILDSVKPSDVESGVFLHEFSSPNPDRVSNQQLRLVSF